MWNVKTPVFEGPLDLLLSLIEKRKLFINDISLSSIADDYIDTVRSLPEIPLKDVANFVFIASTLVLIKSKSLLPSLNLSTEEEGDIEQLKDRLRTYQRIKELSIHVKNSFGKNIIFEREAPKRAIITFSPGEDVILQNIFSAVQNILMHLPKIVISPQAVVKKMITLEDAIGKLVKRIDRHLKMSFKQYSGIGKEEKAVVIVNFLAVLELIKRGAVDAIQKENFSDFDIETREIKTPRY
ncbi:MAG: ScpA family protein [Candidatus Paceibacterota bacterium]|jgi:segregation and condensation protein A|nr:segregation/condensation protein A [Candidatus Paceibacterota bacterium]